MITVLKSPAVSLLGGTKSIPLALHEDCGQRGYLSICPADLLRSLYIVGKTGTGKSALLLRVLLGAVETGFGACLIDPHGDLASQVLENLPARHWNRVVYLHPHEQEPPVGLNLLVPTPGMPHSLVVSGIVEVFRKLWGSTLFGPRSEHLLRNAVLALLESSGTTLLAHQHAAQLEDELRSAILGNAGTLASFSLSAVARRDRAPAGRASRRSLNTKRPGVRRRRIPGIPLPQPACPLATAARLKPWTGSWRLSSSTHRPADAGAPTWSCASASRGTPST